MNLSPEGQAALRRLLVSLLPDEEAAIVMLRHTSGGGESWVGLGRQWGIHPLRADRLYRQALRRLREPGRLLSGLLLESSCNDR